jgi:hypothetical protein
MAKRAHDIFIMNIIRCIRGIAGEEQEVEREGRRQEEEREKERERERERQREKLAWKPMKNKTSTALS